MYVLAFHESRVISVNEIIFALTLSFTLCKFEQVNKIII